MSLPVAERWFARKPVTDRLGRIFEPHADDLLQANVWHLHGRDHDLVIDTGLGVGSLRTELPALFENDPIVVLTHGHLDHVGGASEFDLVHAHPGDRVDEPVTASLVRETLLDALGIDYDDEPGAALLVDAVPNAEWDPHRYAVAPPRAIRWVSDGDVVELGDARLDILHLPGHSAGTIALHDPITAELFTGDCVYDDVLLDQLVGSSIPDYIASMERLRALSVSVVYPGHGEPFDGHRLRELIDGYLATRREN